MGENGGLLVANKNRTSTIDVGENCPNIGSTPPPPNPPKKQWQIKVRFFFWIPGKQKVKKFQLVAGNPG